MTLQGGSADQCRQVRLDQLCPDSTRSPHATRLRRADGSFAELEVFSRDLSLAGQIVRLVVAHDITARLREEQNRARAHRELEQRLHDRTARLQASVQELEAFSYSVSHDLRSPLRGIDGFARALQHDHEAALDADGRRLLSVIRSEAHRMGRLIDDLLAFFRAGRQHPDTAPTDVTELMRSTFQILIETNPAPKVVLDLQPLPPALADRALLRQVLTNLLDNAVKFSRPRAEPRIEVSGWIGADGQATYCVKDNGVGFDENYAHRLFGVFQRLHSQSEFEGTGVGLALAQRIVHRHGGRIWGEGKVGAGARFFFTLPPVPTSTPATAV